MASEDTSTLNDQIAAIYDKLALGDKSALQALQ